MSGPHSAAEHSLVEIDDILNRLAGINPALRRTVELRVFEGLTREEIARQMGCGTATVARYWSFARNWLEAAFAGSPGLRRVSAGNRRTRSTRSSPLSFNPSGSNMSAMPRQMRRSPG